MMNKTCPICSKSFKAREADVKRGWDKFCSKSCKAKEQERRTGQYKDYINRKHKSQNDRSNTILIEPLDSENKF